MRLLIDANLSPRVADGLRSAGFRVDHVADLGLLSATDEQILDHAREHALVVVTADSDFGMMLAISRSGSPSVVQLRHVAELGVAAHLELLTGNLPSIAPELRAGAIASLSPTRLSIRRLPIH